LADSLSTPATPFTIETFRAGDGYEWRYRLYTPGGESRGHVVCVHGIQSHGGWYEHSCATMARAGYTVTFIDRRGAGMNEAARGDATGFRRLMDDIGEYLRTLRGPASPAIPGLGVPASRPHRPIFLLAISWGGKLAVAIQRRHPGLVDGLALLCPGFFPLVRPPLWDRLGIAWSRLVEPERKFAIPLNEPGLFTASPRWQQFIRDDPFALRKATARLLIESVRLDGYLRWTTRGFTVPVLLLLAERDRIINNALTRRFAQRFALGDRETIEYRDAHHTLEFEPEPERFLRDLTGWLDRVTERFDAEHLCH
jgi:alpha-beta hydrolase superfamily lysophospholipase